MKDQFTLVRELIDSADVAMYLKDADGRILAVNDRVAALWGSSKEQLVGKSDPDFATREDAQRIHEMDQKVLDSNAPMTFRLTVTTPRGKVDLFDHKFPVHLDDRTTGIGGVAIEASKIQ